MRAEFLLDRLLAQTEDVDASVGFAVPTVACADRTDPDLVNGGSGTRIVSAALPIELLDADGVIRPQAEEFLSPRFH